jgi:hypothetical protein
MATDGLKHVCQASVIEAMQEGYVSHLLLLARMPDGTFTWESDDALTISEAQDLCDDLLALTKRPRPPSCRKGCGR